MKKTHQNLKKYWSKVCDFIQNHFISLEEELHVDNSLTLNLERNIAVLYSKKLLTLAESRSAMLQIIVFQWEIPLVINNCSLAGISLMCLRIVLFWSIHLRWDSRVFHH